MEELITLEGSVGQASKTAAGANYLGDPAVVDGLLRTFASDVVTADYTNDDNPAQTIDIQARALAKVFLGRDRRFPGPPWNSPGQVDAHLAIRAGIDSIDPEERVAGALLGMVKELFELGSKIGAEKLIGEQWQGAANAIIGKYVKMFLGLPEYS